MKKLHADVRCSCSKCAVVVQLWPEPAFKREVSRVPVPVEALYMPSCQDGCAPCAIEYDRDRFTPEGNER